MFGKISKAFLFFNFLLLCQGGAYAQADQPTAEELAGMASLYCSGTVVNFYRHEDDKAVLLTNGHCVRSRLLDRQEVVLDIPYTRSAIYVFDSKGNKHVVEAGRVLYGTMYTTDIGLIELEETYFDLKKRGIPSYDMASRDATVGEQIKVISGYWKEKRVCKVLYQADLLEYGYEFNNAFALSEGCKIRGGYSGSPMLSKENEVVGIINTVNENGQMCTLNNPCEVDENGQRRIFKDRGYGQQTSQINDCVDKERGEVDLTLATCQLPS